MATSSASNFWFCILCETTNDDPTASFCKDCQCERIPEDTDFWYHQAPSSKDHLSFTEQNTWECYVCTYLNEEVTSQFCLACDAERVDSKGDFSGSHNNGSEFRTQDVGVPPTDVDSRKPAHETGDDEIRIIVIGKTGVGKSATGNTILGKTVFLSAQSGKSQTKVCQREESIRNGQRLVVVDTPGLFDTKVSNEISMKEIVRSVWMVYPGPHVILLVIEIGRYTEEVQNAVDQFVSHFGEDVLNHIIVVFTRNDDLKRNDQDLSEFITDSDKVLKDMLRRIDNRYIAFDNVSGDESNQVELLIDNIKLLTEKKNGKCYSPECYLMAEENMKKRAERMREKEIRSIKETKQQHISPFLECLREDKEENEILRRQLNYEELKAAQLKIEAQSAQNWKESIEMASSIHENRPRRRLRRNGYSVINRKI